MRRLLLLALVVNAVAFPGNAEASLSGCRSVDVARIGRSPLGIVVYKFHHVNGWWPS